MTWERRKPLRRSPLNPGSAPLRGVPLQRGGGLRSRRDREERDEPTGVTSPTTNGPAPRRRASTIRQLQRGEAVPTSTPRRYPNRDGYIRLRWKVGIQQYVEVYEHRVVDGIVTDAEHVHHDNLVRHDNEPGNLVELTADEHNQLHADMRRGQRTYGPYRSKSAKAKAERAQARRAELAEQVAEMRRLYLDEKLSAGQIGQRIGIDPSNVSRRLRAAGVRMRPAVGISDERQRTVPRKTSYKRTDRKSVV